ncbi:unnamed protein product [Effrenium voratum]|uniref:RRM domain-containing protein n=1 Tax=Effrenium voratum TaxID=2562239 RepID=A0AA36MVB9_9DINO|nr:unnamed protein product [Effrenium voratum]
MANALAAFVEANENGLNEEAKRVLLSMSPEEQAIVIERGSLSGCKNPVAVIKSRVKQPRLKQARRRPVKDQVSISAAKRWAPEPRAPDPPRQLGCLAVGNLAPCASVFDLHAIFSFMDGLVAVRVFRNKDVPELLSHGLCEFISVDCAEQAMKDAQGIELLGQSLELKLLDEVDYSGISKTDVHMAQETHLDAARQVFIPKTLRR